MQDDGESNASEKHGGAEHVSQRRFQRAPHAQPNENTSNEINQQIARYTRQLVWFTGLLFVATAVLAGYAAKQGYDMGDAVEAAKISAQAAKDAVGLDRAWIGSPKISFIKKGSGYTFSYGITNVGKSPVVGLYLVTDIYSDDQQKSATFNALLKRAGSEAKQQFIARDQADPTRHLIVPQDTFNIETGGGAKAEITAQQVNDATNNGVIFYLIGAAAYKSRPDDVLRTTGFSTTFRVKGGAPSLEAVWTFDAE